MLFVDHREPEGPAFMRAISAHFYVPATLDRVPIKGRRDDKPSNSPNTACASKFWRTTEETVLLESAQLPRA